jgi:hypothetical protein
MIAPAATMDQSPDGESARPPMRRGAQATGPRGSDG